MSRVSVFRKVIYHVNTDVVLDLKGRRSRQTGRLLLGKGRFYFFLTSVNTQVCGIKRKKDFYV